MSHKHRVHTAISVEFFFEGKNHQSLGNIFFQQSHSSLPPGPKLWTYVIHHGDVALAHLSRHAPVESRRINYNGQLRGLRDALSDELTEQPPDFWKMAENFRDAYDG